MNLYYIILNSYIIIIFLSIIHNKFIKKRKKINNKTVLITGGSSGLGLEIAKICAKRNCNVIIMSRNENKLIKAKNIIKNFSISNSQKIEIFVGDVTTYQDCEKIKQLISEKYNKINYLFCCAGSAEPGYFKQQNIEIFRSQMNLNYFGTLNIIKACLPLLIKYKEGHIVMIGSAMSLFSMIGYSQYGPSKWAVRCLSDTLRNELILYNIKVSIFYPSNMDTNGLKLEEKTKPAETRFIEGKASLYNPAKSAEYLISEVELGRYSITQDYLIYLLRVGMNGVNPRNNVILEICLLPFVFVIEAFQLVDPTYLV